MFSLLTCPHANHGAAFPPPPGFALFFQFKLKHSDIFLRVIASPLYPVGVASFGQVVLTEDSLLRTRIGILSIVDV